MIQYIIIGALSVVVIGLILLLRKEKGSNKEVIDTKVQNTQLRDTNKALQGDVINLQEELGTEREKNRFLLSQKKSSETRLGQISEHLVPFLEGCTHEPKNMHFLGNPIDYVVFDFDQGAITFLEVKSGNSKASKRQKTIKNIIKSGRIYYEEIRINEKGVKNKIAANANQMSPYPVDVDLDGDEEGEDESGED